MLLRQMNYSGHIMADILRQTYYGRCIMANILRKLYYSRYIMADMLRQMHYVPGATGAPLDLRGPPGTPRPRDAPGTPRGAPGPPMDIKNGHVSTSLQRQKLSIAVFKPAHCEPAPQGLPRAVLFVKNPPESKNALGPLPWRRSCPP